MTVYRRLRTLIIVTLSIVLSGMTPVSAVGQEPTVTEPSDPVGEAIEQSSGGTVSVEIPEELLQLILQGAPRQHNTRPAASSQPRQHKTGKARGWRIQVFADGRNPSTLGARARARGNAIVARFPKYRGQVYTFSTSPNWYTRIGNFRTAGEANAALAELKRAFPAFASEMRTVQCTVILR